MRLGCANVSLFFAYQATSSARSGSRAAADVLGQELHLLRHAALDDRVVLVEAHRQRLAVEDFLLHAILDQSPELFGSRLAPPLRLEHERELAELLDRQPNLLRRHGRVASTLRELPGAEQHGAQQQEVDQRLAQQSSQRVLLPEVALSGLTSVWVGMTS